jgi:hypothetical protein
MKGDVRAGAGGSNTSSESRYIRGNIKQVHWYMGVSPEMLKLPKFERCTLAGS